MHDLLKAELLKLKKCFRKLAKSFSLRYSVNFNKRQVNFTISEAVFLKGFFSICVTCCLTTKPTSFTVFYVCTELYIKVSKFFELKNLKGGNPYYLDYR